MCFLRINNNVIYFNVMLLVCVYFWEIYGYFLVLLELNDEFYIIELLKYLSLSWNYMF